MQLYSEFKKKHSTVYESTTPEMTKLGLRKGINRPVLKCRNEIWIWFAWTPWFWFSGFEIHSAVEGFKHTGRQRKRKLVNAFVEKAQKNHAEFDKKCGNWTLNHKFDTEMVFHQYASVCVLQFLMDASKQHRNIHIWLSGKCVLK